MKHKDLDPKIQNCTNAYKSYGHLINNIKVTIKSGDFKQSSLMINIDNYVTDNSPIVDKFLRKYNEKFNFD